MYAIFRAAGFQYRAEPGDTLKVPTLEAAPGAQVEFGEVLLGATEDEVVVGTPLVDGAKVLAEVLRHGRGAKVIVWKFKRRKNYRRKQGHRQDFTEVRVQAVDLGNGRRAEAPTARVAAPKKPRKRAPKKAARRTAPKKTAAKAKGAARKAARKTTKKKSEE